eukprot:CAMPEP_0197628794 /NCGR_PEP_ID=MMETSP1338-20131121/6941_1 /TAXON_ID=43686 ORGANISM="Pelagodinium beii, Strain RCC1491" /NCGR_SAMPLE_ID=MMETSP1338 /ASSEMBLY_ACC=CAM_ASM_000754 /LENGTH=295 /DNA_ID=CAMNT_0043199791 /DNA_START=74 /DNA_END=961 /DNA_ORIENTATION=-
MEQGKYSVQLQWMSQTILDQVITEPGLSYVGLGNFLIEFPSTFQTMYFVKDRRGIPSLEEFGDGNAQLFAPAVRGPIRARSADGLEMIVSFSFQWRLMPENLKDLYNILGNHMYKDEFVRFARAAVIESCSFFAADEYFVSRAKITDKIKEVLTAYFSNAELGLQMEIEGVQMREVDLPDDFDHEIANTQEQMQEADVAAAMRKEEVIAKERELLVAEQKVREVLQAAEAEAERVRLDNEAQITRLMMLQLKEAEANSEILQKFEDDPNPFDRLFEMMSLRAITNHDEKKIMLNM